MRPWSLRYRRSAAGLTLVELLTAMMVSVLLIGTAFSTFWTATRAWEKARRRTEMIRLLEGVAGVLTRHIRAMQPPFFEENPAFVAYNDGDEEAGLDYDTVIFLSAANARFPRELALADLCEIEFFIDTGSRGQADNEQVATDSNVGGLWMRIDPTPDDDVESGGYLVALGEQVVSLDFRFFDGYEWLEEWYFDNEVPEAIEFTITVSDPDGLENPMTLTRLVTVPTAATINNMVSTSAYSYESETGTTAEQEFSEETGSAEAGGPGGE